MATTNNVVEDVKCPECEKMAKVAPVSQEIGRFLDWMQQEKEFLFTRYHVHSEQCEDEDGSYECGFYKDALEIVHVQPEKLLAEFFQIDLDKVENERRALLDAIRKRSEVQCTS